MRLLASLPFLLGLIGSASRADEQPVPAAAPRTSVDGGLVVGLPAALPTGITTGVGAGVTRGGALAYGARVSWSSATEYTLTWTVRHEDLRLRLFGALQHREGRGTIALRLGAGGTLVHEKRIRAQGSRAGLSGSDLETTAWRMLPAADLELVVHVGLAGDVSLVLSAGPSFVYHDGAEHTGFVSALGVAWSF